MKLPRVHRVRRKGTVYKYHKATRAKLPNDVPEDHPSFITAWTAEEAKKPTAGPVPDVGSISAGVSSYFASEAFKGLSKEYAATIRRHVEAIRESYGTGRARDLQARHIDMDIAKLSGNLAVARRKAWRQLGDHLKRSGMAASNPAKGIETVKSPKGKGFTPWSLSEIEAYRARWPVGTPQRLAFELLFWTAARTVDGVTLSPSMVGHDGMLTFTQSKTGGQAYVPWTSSLPAWGDQMESDRAHLMACIRRGTFTYLETAGGKARTKKGLSNLIADAARAAKITDRSAHGLRKSRLTIIAELGGSAHAIMAWGGHKTLAEAQAYTERASRKRILIRVEQEQNVVKRSDPNGKTPSKMLK